MPTIVTLKNIVSEKRASFEEWRKRVDDATKSLQFYANLLQCNRDEHAEYKSKENEREALRIFGLSVSVQRNLAPQIAELARHIIVLKSDLRDLKARLGEAASELADAEARLAQEEIAPRRQN